MSKYATPITILYADDDANLAPIHNGLTALESAGEAYSKSFTRALDGGAPALASVREVNANLIAVERALTLDEGLPGRPWYRHQIYAPGFFTGYDMKTLPGVRESLEQKQWKLAEEQALRNTARSLQQRQRVAML